ncbi:sel1 repeat family protein [Pectobacterium carotovorum]|uniref:tetratricopeptide repeat protein n=1 Tax=Pectobacterium carotovorum TaxID=554 RepID=UPI00068E6327|nr:tetratricopeptide repeat protein [Pectobacterium carotovorum]MBL0867496.1 sel1 repeat family protein [Pectobacterium carotovorum]
MKFISLLFVIALSLILPTAHAVASDVENKTLAEMQQLANNGNVDAQLALGDMYYDGDGIEEDYAQAKTWYMKAAGQGNAYAQLMLGDMYYNGDGVEKDYAQAKAWYTKSAEQGSAEAQYELGTMYFDEKESAKAISWFKKAAEQGMPDAHFDLAVMYLNGVGTPVNARAAFTHFKDAAEQNMQKAQFMTSAMYADGIGVKKNDSQAYFWFSVFNRNEKDLEWGSIPDIQKAIQIHEKRIQEIEKNMSQSELQKSKRLQDKFISKHNNRAQ